jgi:hypothetical protein
MKLDELDNFESDVQRLTRVYSGSYDFFSIPPHKQRSAAGLTQCERVYSNWEGPVDLGRLPSRRVIVNHVALRVFGVDQVEFPSAVDYVLKHSDINFNNQLCYYDGRLVSGWAKSITSLESKETTTLLAELVNREMQIVFCEVTHTEHMTVRANCLHRCEPYFGLGFSLTRLVYVERKVVEAPFELV